MSLLINIPAMTHFHDQHHAPVILYVAEDSVVIDPIDFASAEIRASSSGSSFNAIIAYLLVMPMLFSNFHIFYTIRS